MKKPPRPGSLIHVDRRTREGRLLDKVRAELTAHVGGSPSPVQRMIIDQIGQQKLLLAKLDRQFAEAGTPPTACDVTAYNQLSGHLDRLMRRLGPKAPTERTPGLAELLAQSAARRAAAPRDAAGHIADRPSAHGASALPSPGTEAVAA